MSRQDIHRPSAINPADYDFVAYDYIGPWPVYEAAFIKTERAAFKAHAVKTGGHRANHKHGGTCDVCGATAFYVAHFHHRPTNTYILTGEDCAEKMQLGDTGAFRSFRDKVKAEHGFVTGKAKAKQILTDENMLDAWALYEATDKSQYKYEESTVTDIVSRLVRTGNITERAKDFAKQQMLKIPERDARNAKKEADWANALPVPIFGPNRVNLVGKVLVVKQPDPMSAFPSWKLMILHKDGWKVWGTRPSSLSSVKVGEYVSMEAVIVPSPNDPKFGFYSRPSKGKFVTEDYNPLDPAVAAVPTKEFFWNGMTIRNGKVVG